MLILFQQVSLLCESVWVKYLTYTHRKILAYSYPITTPCTWYTDAHCVKVLVIIHDDISLVFPKIAQETSIFHIRHDNGWSTSNAHTHTNQGHHIRMIKVFHLQNFICHVVYIVHCEKTCWTKKDHHVYCNHFLRVMFGLPSNWMESSISTYLLWHCEHDIPYIFVSIICQYCMHDWILRAYKAGYTLYCAKLSLVSP